ncbi:MAG TPA: phosphatase PAP2 family protein [Vicinamibacterales bacterium]
MRTRHVLLPAVLALILLPAFAHAQQPPPDMSSALIGRAFNTVVASDLAASSTPAAEAVALPDVLPPPAEAHPTPEHTGWAALGRDLWSDFKALPRRPSTWVILGIGAGSALIAHPVDDDVNAHLVGKRGLARIWAPGKYLGAAYTQAGVSIGLWAIGRYVVPPDPDQPLVEGVSPRTNKWSHMGFDLLRAQIVAQTVVQATKFAVRRDRPTGVCCSFPSGHAAAAWAAASVVERHFGYRMALPTIVIASYVATSRLHENVHFLSDVLMGSSIGVATGWTVVGRHGRSAYALTPVPVRGGLAMQISRVNRGE